jgi:hypothetical protein
MYEIFESLPYHETDLGTCSSMLILLNRFDVFVTVDYNIPREFDCWTSSLDMETRETIELGQFISIDFFIFYFLILHRRRERFDSSTILPYERIPDLEEFHQ